MASPDLSVFQRIKTKQDFDREAAEFLMKKQAAQRQLAGTDPAAVKLANELQAARASGDTQRINDLIISAKLVDRGVVMDANGRPMAMGGYGDAVGSIAGAKKAYEANAQNVSDLQYDPQIAAGEAQARQAQELRYADPIAQAKKSGEITAAQLGELAKKADNARGSMGLTDSARFILEGEPDATGKATKDTPTNSYAGAAGALFNRAFGISTEDTQADAKLAVIAGNLISNVPRMEGPQSNADLQFYKEQAGKVGDRTVPIADRLAALDAIDNLNAKYAGYQTPTSTAMGIPQMQMDGEELIPYNPTNMPSDVGLGNVDDQVPGLYERSKAEFDNKKPKKRLVYNPATGEFE